MTIPHKNLYDTCMVNIVYQFTNNTTCSLYKGSKRMRLLGVKKRKIYTTEQFDATFSDAE